MFAKRKQDVKQIQKDIRYFQKILQEKKNLIKEQRAYNKVQQTSIDIIQAVKPEGGGIKKKQL